MEENINLESEGILRELQFDFSSFTIESFIQCIGEAKGRQIITIPWDMPPTLFGAWISDEEEPNEYIFYRRNVPVIHQIHIQLHELSHFLFGHPTLQINRKLIAEVVAGTAFLPFTELPQLRSPKRADVETAAETLANLIQERAIRNSRLDELTHALSSDERLVNFVKTMGLA